MDASQLEELRYRAEAELRLKQVLSEKQGEIETNWFTWLRTLFPDYVSAPFAAHHKEFWNWMWAINDKAPRPMVMVLNRGGGKSTMAELSSVYVGAKNLRAYVWYIRSTQDRANDSVGNIQELLETYKIENYYPGLGDRMTGKFGQVRGWRRNFLRTNSGFTVEAVGLDTAVRGARVGEHRPDFIIFDDIDDTKDTPIITKRKEDIIKYAILPAAKYNAGVVAIQNLLIADGIFARLVSGEADYLRDKQLIGPIKAVDDLVYEFSTDTNRYTITGGTPTWKGMTKEICEDFIARWGLTSFLREAQHEVQQVDGGMFSHIEYQHIRREDLPPLLRVVTWMDPAISHTDKSDSCAIQIDGIDEEGVIYRLYSWERVESPLEAMVHAILKGMEFGSSKVGVETDQGGDTWLSVYELACQAVVKRGHFIEGTVFPAFDSEKASSTQKGKIERSRMALADYENGRIIHVLGTHPVLEVALNRFPASKPYDLVDAAFYGWYDLRGKPKRYKAGTWGQTVPKRQNG